MKRLVTAGLGLFVFTLLLVPISILGKRPASVLSFQPVAARTGAQSKRKPSATEDLYRTNCARCHGADGGGDTPLGHTYNSPDFTDNAWWQKHSDITSTRSLVSIVVNGKGGMPAFGKKLKSSEIKGLVNYVRNFGRVNEKSSANVLVCIANVRFTWSCLRALPVDVRKSSAFPTARIISRGYAAIASPQGDPQRRHSRHNLRSTNRKSGAFPHIERQSRTSSFDTYQ